MRGRIVYIVGQFISDGIITICIKFYYTLTQMLEMPSHTYEQLRQFEHSIYHTSLVYTTNNLNKVRVSDLHTIQITLWVNNTHC